jgi:hypothetical protein
MAMKLTESYVQSIISKLKTDVQALAVFKGEYNVQLKEYKEQSEVTDDDGKSSKKAEQARNNAAKLEAKHNELKDKLQQSKKDAEQLKNRLNQELSGVKHNIRTFNSRTRSLRTNKKLLTPAEKAAERDARRLEKWLQELNTLLQSSQHQLKSDNTITDPNFRYDPSWVMLFDRKGNPFLKSRGRESFQETIHFDSGFGISQRPNPVHVKINEGFKPSFNPSDAFIAKALFEKPEYGGVPVYEVKKKDWVSSGPSLLDQLYTAKNIYPYPKRGISGYTPPVSSNYQGVNFGQQNIMNSYGHSIGQVHNNYGNREIRNNMGGLEGKIHNEFGREFLVDSSGSKSEILVDGSVLNPYGVKQSTISNYSSATPSMPSGGGYSPVTPISTFMSNIGSGMAGMGSYSPSSNSMGSSGQYSGSHGASLGSSGGSYSGSHGASLGGSSGMGGGSGGFGGPGGGF